jgi:hypothetical protein
MERQIKDQTVCFLILLTTQYSDFPNTMTTHDGERAYNIHLQLTDTCTTKRSNSLEKPQTSISNLFY